jgi:hypothetical protein
MQAAEEAGRSRIYGGIHFEYQPGRPGARPRGRPAGARRFALTSDTQAPAAARRHDGGTAPTSPHRTGARQPLRRRQRHSSARRRRAAGARLRCDRRPLHRHHGAGDSTAGRRRHTITSPPPTRRQRQRAATRSFTLDTRAPAITLTSLADGDHAERRSRLSRQRQPHRQRAHSSWATHRRRAHRRR